MIRFRHYVLKEGAVNTTAEKGMYGLSVRPCFGYLDPLRVLEALRTSPFRYLEMTADEGEFFDRWTRQPTGIRKRIEDAGLSVWSVHGPRTGWSLGDLDEDARRDAVDATRTAFKPAAEVGADVVVVHSNKSRDEYPPGEYEPCLEATRVSLETLAPIAADFGLRLAVENMAGRSMTRPGMDVSEVLDLISGLGEHVGICFDTGHSNSAQKQVANQIRSAGHKLFTLHLNDTSGLIARDDHYVPGDGTIDWSDVLSALDEICFSSPRILEVKNRVEPEAGIALLERLSAVAIRWTKSR